MSSYQTARRQVERLVAKYEALDSRQRQRYSEAHTRQDFIEPLFQALGWNIHDSKEVSEEEQVSRGRVDYAFRLQGVPRFLLEAKAIPVDLDEARWAVQAITYAYNKCVPWAVLTDFEGLKVFNAEWDEPEVMRCRFLDLTYRDYVEDFDKLWWLSKESFLENRLAKEAAKVGAARKRVPVGERLYSQFREWRELLFKYLFKYNKDCPLRDIDEAIQRILDRLIFIRTCEDRGIEEPMLLPLLRQWKARATRRDLWDELKETFQHFDVAYNSRLFQPHLCDALECEATPFETILQELYSREGEVVRYDFSAIGVDVLGRVYEQYLGHVARVAQVVAEEEAKRRSLIAHLPGLAPKPELTIELAAKKIKRKERGIYYTPQFVVDYIVEHTLRAFLKDCSKDQAERVRVLDPACGSGSFLITAYERLMGYFAELQQLAVLPQEERLEILTRSIYGVDLDAQAVEIAQLNLLLKALEEPALLPDLSDNIRRGNSLISGGEDELRRYFGDDWEEKRPFNWEREFSEIMAEGGFDIVISNPPYGAEFGEDEKEFFRDKFPSAESPLDSFALFVERSIELLATGGRFGFIVPDTLLTLDRFVKLRKKLLSSFKVTEIRRLGPGVFPDAVVSTILLFVQRPFEGESLVGHATRITSDETKGEISQSWFYQQPCHKLSLELSSKEILRVVDKIDARAIALAEIAIIRMGLKTGRNEKFLIDSKQLNRLAAGGQTEGEYVEYQRSVLDLVKQIVRGTDLSRYGPIEADHFVLYDVEEMKKEPNARPRSYSADFDLPKILLKDVIGYAGERLTCTFDECGLYPLDTVYFVQIKLRRYSLKYLLGLLNSRLLNFWYRVHNTGIHVKASYLKPLPIRRIDFGNPEDVAMHDEMVRLVERMLELHRRKAALRDTPTEELRELEREIERADGEIDALVYQLYGLTEEEVAVVEGRNR